MPTDDFSMKYKQKEFNFNDTIQITFLCLDATGLLCWSSCKGRRSLLMRWYNRSELGYFYATPCFLTKQGFYWCKCLISFSATPRCKHHSGQALTCVWDIWRGVMMWLIFVQNLHRSKRRREAVSVWQPQELPIYSFNVAHCGPLWPIVAWITTLEKVPRVAERGLVAIVKW